MTWTLRIRIISKQAFMDGVIFSGHIKLGEEGSIWEKPENQLVLLSH